MKIEIEGESSTVQGVIESPFGSTGKFKVCLKDPLPKDVKVARILYKVNIFEGNKKLYQ